MDKFDKLFFFFGFEEDYFFDYSFLFEDVIEDEEGNEFIFVLDVVILRIFSKIKKREGVYGGENVF